MNLFNILLTIFNLVSNPPNIETVPSLDINKYVGSWYQVYDNNYNKLFINNGECIRHNYYRNFNTLMHVNYLDLNDENKTIANLSAELLTDKENEGKFSLADSNYIGSNYYVTKLGPVVDNKYDYAVVTDSLGLSLFVLTRSLDSFYINYKLEIDTFLNNTCGNDEVVDFLTAPQKVNNQDCKIFI